MLIEKIKFVVAGLLLGLALVLPASAPAVAHGLVRDGHTTVANRSVARPVSAVPIPVRLNAAPTQASGKGAIHHDILLPKVTLAKFFPRARGGEAVLTSSSWLPTSYDEAGGYGCCGTNPGCCGMSCGVAALPVSPPSLPAALGDGWATSASQLSRAANFDTLFRPPCCVVR